MDKYSSCCGAGVDVDKLICLDCKEHCGVDFACGNCGEVVDKVNLEGWCRDCDDLEMTGNEYG